MSTLGLVLTAAMTVPGNGPEMVLAEMEQGLHLSGEWEATRSDKDRRSHNPILREAALDREAPAIPWWQDRRIHFVRS